MLGVTHLDGNKASLKLIKAGQLTKNPRITPSEVRLKLMREETADYNVVPTANGTKKKLTLLSGRCWHKGKYEQFTGEPTPEQTVSTAI